MKIVGKTQDGKQVVTGVAKLYFEYGIPLSVIFDNLTHYNQVPAWNQLVRELEGNGMDFERILHLLNEHIFESYGKQFRDTVIERITCSRKAKHITS